MQDIYVMLLHTDTHLRTQQTHTHTCITNTHTDTYAHRQTATHMHRHTSYWSTYNIYPYSHRMVQKGGRYMRSILSTLKFTLNIKASIISKAWLTSLMLQTIKDNTQAMPTIGRSNPRHSFFTQSALTNNANICNNNQPWLPIKT